MAKSFAPLRVVGTDRPDPVTFILIIEHDAAQSYSRAVKPFAFREAAKVPTHPDYRGEQWYCTGAEDHGTVEAGAEVKRGTRCLTAYTFTCRPGA